MKYLIPFIFPASVLEKRRRTYQDELFLSSVEVDVPVTSVSEAPVVATVSDTDGSGRNICEFRHFNGEFYRSPKFALTVDDLVSGKMAAKHLSYYGPYQVRVDELVEHWNSAQRSNAGEIIGGENVRDWGRDSVEEMKATVESSVRDYLVVDGTIWERCPEPRLAIETMFSNPRPSVVVTSIDSDRRWNSMPAKTRSPYDNPDFINPLWLTHFRLDDLSNAENWLRSRGAVFATPFSIEILDDSVFQFDRADDIAQRVAAAFLNGAAPELITKSDGFIDTWKAVRQLASAHLDDEAQEALTSLISGVVEEIGYEPLRKMLVAAVEDWTVDAARPRPASLGVGGSEPWPHTPGR